MSKYITMVRYGLMMQSENFVSSIDGLEIGQTVILRSSRGVDYGIVVKPQVPMEREVKGLGTILRVASDDDIGIISHIQDVKEPEELAYCKERIAERKLPMKLAGIEHLFSSDKVVFYFLADGRVDFRELVKDLARRYRTRIEMRQIGVRDEARLLSDYEHCGRELCCRTFMRQLEPVTMRMAKMQKTTLDPTKISGHCGRLMCCLRFEDEVYSTHKKELPHKGETVTFGNDTGMVLGTEILSQKVTLRTNKGDIKTVHLSEIEVHEKREGGRKGENRNRKGSRNENKNQNDAKKSHDCENCPNSGNRNDRNNEKNANDKSGEREKQKPPQAPAGDKELDEPVTPESLLRGGTDDAQGTS